MKSLIETDVGEKRWPCHFCSEGCTSQMRHHTFLWDNCIPICLSPFLCESVKQHTEDAVPFSLHSLNGQFVREAWHQRARRSNFFNKGWCDTLWQPVIPQFSSSKCGGGLSHTLTSTHHPVQFPVVNRAAVYSLSLFFLSLKMTAVCLKPLHLLPSVVVIDTVSIEQVWGNCLTCRTQWVLKLDRVKGQIDGAFVWIKISDM